MKSNIKAYHTAATTTIKKLAQKRPKIDIYDDSSLELLDDMASKWAMRVDRLKQQRQARKLHI